MADQAGKIRRNTDRYPYMDGIPDTCIADAGIREWSEFEARIYACMKTARGDLGSALDRVVTVFTETCWVRAFHSDIPVRKVRIEDSYAAWSFWFRAVMGYPEPFGPAMYLAIMHEWRGFRISRHASQSFHEGGHLDVRTLCAAITGTDSLEDIKQSIRHALLDAEKCGAQLRPKPANTVAPSTALDEVSVDPVSENVFVVDQECPDDDTCRKCGSVDWGMYGSSTTKDAHRYCRNCRRRRAEEFELRRKSSYGSHTQKQWEEKRDSYTHCSVCGRAWEAIPARPSPRYKDVRTRRRIVKLSQGGSDDISNIEPACYSCTFSERV
jgi:hypothetical protein